MPVVDLMRDTTARPKQPSRFGNAITRFGPVITHFGNVITCFGKVIGRFGKVMISDHLRPKRPISILRIH